MSKNKRNSRRLPPSGKSFPPAEAQVSNLAVGEAKDPNRGNLAQLAARGVAPMPTEPVTAAATEPLTFDNPPDEFPVEQVKTGWEHKQHDRHPILGDFTSATDDWYKGK